MDLSVYKNILPDSYIKKGQDALNTKQKIIDSLLYHKKLPEEGWTDKMIEDLLSELTRPTCSKEIVPINDMVFKRNCNIHYGCSLSDVKRLKKEVKSDAGIIINQLANSLVSELIKLMGIKRDFECAVIPVATGMSLIFSMLTFRALKPNARYVLWSRIDQKSCFKAIVSAGFIPVIVDTKCVNDEHVTDIDCIQEQIIRIGAEKICCIVSTTSCFAPRACDSIEVIAEICNKNNIYHLINNAYGLSNRNLMKRINKASIRGRVDIFVQSTDKNLCVPVGGAIVVSFNNEIFSKFTDICSEKMSNSAAIDTIMTLLHMGRKKYIQLLDECETMYKYLKFEMLKLANKYNERIIENPGNPISIALTLSNVPQLYRSQIGPMLYVRNVSGARVVTADDTKIICNFNFERWGTHCSKCDVPYLTAAASIGIVKSDVDAFMEKLNKIFHDISFNK